jgi:mitogen-activated protein kinase kinase
MKAFQESRQGTPPGGRPHLATSSSGPLPESPTGTPVIGGLSGGLRLPPSMRPQPHGFSSAPAVPRAKPSLSARRNMKLPSGLPPVPGDGPKQPNADGSMPGSEPNGGTMFTKFSDYVDTKNGTLKFAGKAVIHSQGVDFSSGTNFSISLDEVDTLEELGKGNYGTVYKVRHARPRIRKPGLGLTVQRSSSMSEDSAESSPVSKPGSGTTGIIMAMKEIRLELDEAKFAAIIMELDILHRCVSPYIIDFYGAFFQEGAVYICIEFMDGGSIDKLYGDGVPENVLRKIAYATTVGLKELKDVHNIIHRDVKPTNILVNTRGQVKICDFGVSGNLVASIAKTNIGCQSYMAPERISGGGVAQAGANPGGGTYSVQSDIWSLGLTIIECAMGRYPYPPETYNNIFSQLSVSFPRLVLVAGANDLRRSSMATLQTCLRKVILLKLETLFAAV